MLRLAMLPRQRHSDLPERIWQALVDKPATGLTIKELSIALDVVPPRIYNALTRMTNISEDAGRLYPWLPDDDL